MRKHTGGEVILYLGEFNPESEGFANVVLFEAAVFLLHVFGLMATITIDKNRVFPRLTEFGLISAVVCLAYATFQLRTKLKSKAKALKRNTEKPQPEKLEAVQKSLTTYYWACALFTAGPAIVWSVIAVLFLVGNYVVIYLAALIYYSPLVLKQYLKFVIDSHTASRKELEVMDQWIKFSNWLKLQKITIQGPAELTQRYAEYLALQKPAEKKE